MKINCGYVYIYIMQSMPRGCQPSQPPYPSRRRRRCPPARGPRRACRGSRSPQSEASWPQGTPPSPWNHSSSSWRNPYTFIALGRSLIRALTREECHLGGTKGGASVHTCRANIVHVRQSRPDSGLSFKAKVLGLRSGASWPPGTPPDRWYHSI